MSKTVHDLIVWDRESIATLPPEAQEDFPCENPYDWTPVEASAIPTTDEED